MATITIAQINTAIRDALAGVNVKEAQDYNEITENIVNWPLLQVYWESLEQDPTTSTERSTFTAGVRQTDLVYHVDLYTSRRAHSKQILADMYPLIDEVTAVFEAQDSAPFFGLDGVKAFSFSAQRAIFEYANEQYNGVRWILNIRVF
jgi:hypothetical protein